MKKITQVLNSPFKIGVFALCTIILICVVAFASLQVGASVNGNKAIGINKGVEVALRDAGFTAEEVSDLNAHYDNDDGVASYDIDFTVGGFEYDYTIKASDGTIIEANREKIDGTKIDEQDKTGKIDDVDDDDKTDDADKADDADSQSAGSSQNNNSATNSGSNNTSSTYIGVDKAKSIALKDAGLAASSVKFTKAKLDREDGTVVYEIEFYTNGTEYEYEVNAKSGKITNKDVDWNDDDDDDHWDHDDHDGDDDHDDDDHDDHDDHDWDD